MSNNFMLSPTLPHLKTPTRTSSELLPIRSVYYRKQKPVKLDPLQFDSTGSTMQTMSPQLSNGFSPLDIRSAMTEDTEKKTTVLSSRPTTFRTTFHMFSSTTRSRTKKHPQIEETPRKPFFKPPALSSSVPISSDAQFTVREFIIQMQKAQPPRNYFSDQVYEHYGSEKIINDPMRFTKYDQLADPNRFMKRNIHQKDLQIPTEQEIKQTNRLRFSENIADHENENTVAIHFLGAAAHNIKHLEDSLKTLIKEMEIFRREKESFKQELKDLDESDERVRRELVNTIMSGIRGFRDSLRQDTVDNHNEKIRMTKDLVSLQRDKLSLDQGIQEGLEKLQATEVVLMGFEAFDLQADDRNLETISLQNLRGDMQSSMTNRPIIH